MELLKILGLFVATALAEIIGCYLPYLWLKHDRTAWLLLPAAASLAAWWALGVVLRVALRAGRADANRD